MVEGVSQEDHIKESNQKFMYGYSASSYFYETLRILNINIDFNFIENELDFKNPLGLTSLLFLNSPEALDNAKKTIEEIYRKFPDFDSRSIT